MKFQYVNVDANFFFSQSDVDNILRLSLISSIEIDFVQKKKDIKTKQGLQYSMLCYHSIHVNDNERTSLLRTICLTW